MARNAVVSSAGVVGMYALPVPPAFASSSNFSLGTGIEFGKPMTYVGIGGVPFAY